MFSEGCPVCECTWASSNCVHISKQDTGTPERPYEPEPRLDPITGNLLECGPAGLAAFLPPYLLDPPACNVYSNQEQVIGYDVAQHLFFNSERYDTDSMHDDAEHSDRISFQTPGVYLVSLNLRWNKTKATTGDLAAFIRRTGSEFLAVDSMPIGGPDLFAGHSMSVEGEFEAGDYVEAMVKQDTVDSNGNGKNLTVTVRRNSPVFSAMFLRPPT